MPRITRDGVMYHPDQCDRRTGEPLTPASPRQRLVVSPAYFRRIRLATSGYTGPRGGWYTAPDGTRLRGQAAALAHLAEAERADEAETFVSYVV